MVARVDRNTTPSLIRRATGKGRPYRVIILRMVVPSPRSTRTFLGLEGPVPIAHRGGAAERPENTMAAFEHAVDLGYRCIETDVRATRDRVVAVFHDATLDRLTNHAGPIAARNWADLADVQIDGSAPIVRLDELLGSWPDLRLIIDPKADDVVAPLLDVLRRTRAPATGSASDRSPRTVCAGSAPMRPDAPRAAPPKSSGYVPRPGVFR